MGGRRGGGDKLGRDRQKQVEIIRLFWVITVLRAVPWGETKRGANFKRTPKSSSEQFNNTNTPMQRYLKKIYFASGAKL